MQWRIRLDGLAEHDRPKFISAFLERFYWSLEKQFPVSLGYQFEAHRIPGILLRSRLPQVASWQFSRGRFWGLHIGVYAHDLRLASLRVSIRGYYPLVNSWSEWADRLERVPGGAVLNHILFVPLLIVTMALLPFLFLYRISRLSQRSNVRLAALALVTIWPEMQGYSPSPLSLSRMMPRSLIYFLGAIATTGVTVLCFWLAGLRTEPDIAKAAFYVVGAILVIPSVSLVIATVMTQLGFDA